MVCRHTTIYRSPQAVIRRRNAEIQLRKLTLLNRIIAQMYSIPHSADRLPYCHGLNSMELMSTSSLVVELSMLALCSVYLPLYLYTSSSPQGVGAISLDISNHLGVNWWPMASLCLFSALCRSSNLNHPQIQS